VQNKL